MLRYMLQQIHFLTLVLSNYQSAYPPPRDLSVDRWRMVVVDLLTQVGLIPRTAHGAVMEDEHFKAIRRAGDLADELAVAELSKVGSFLRELTAVQAKDKQGSFTESAFTGPAPIMMNPV